MFGDVFTLIFQWVCLKLSRLLQICWLMNHYRTRHARAANPFHCVIEGCQMRFSTTYRLEEHVRVEHINPPKPGSLFYLRFCFNSATKRKKPPPSYNPLRSGVFEKYILRFEFNVGGLSNRKDVVLMTYKT
ncbi:unnamed protein product [Heligmosomoides polygyrus]|uniref:C2H2-type domain-containing protein n=1 Tax=Heligmosomoides polygyrus TaxID=6339 RepID=A0A3P7YXJ1_HELPZ|nr:unnamed protein product [Heligmosomoides polygyrus]